ncbi:MAG: KH domain-containing protein [Clostridiales bacterium]|jgi:predicted RNA-binding protein YlqC (UPF0109 family)|nr:KH domain-containing protein [Clostridiales bacterium]
MAAVEVAKYIVEQFAVTGGTEVTVSDTEITVTLDKEDMGKVIGKQGKTAKAIRSVVRAASSRDGKRLSVEFKEKIEL